MALPIKSGVTGPAAQPPSCLVRVEADILVPVGRLVLATFFPTPRVVDRE